jgi:hypothetical protein
MAAPLSFKVRGRVDDGRFGEPVLFLDFCLVVAVGEVARGPDGNGVNGGNFLQQVTAFSAHDIYGLAPAGFIHQPPQIGFGLAQAETVRPEIDFPAAERTIRNIHRLTIACLWADVEPFFRSQWEWQGFFV